MKLNPKKNLTPQQISEYREMNKIFIEEGVPIRIDVPELKQHSSSPRVVVYPGTIPAIGPNPPSPEAVQRAQFIDKTYVWTGK